MPTAPWDLMNALAGDLAPQQSLDDYNQVQLWSTLGTRLGTNVRDPRRAFQESNSGWQRVEPSTDYITSIVPGTYSRPVNSSSALLRPPASSNPAFIIQQLGGGKDYSQYMNHPPAGSAAPSAGGGMPSGMGGAGMGGMQALARQMSEQAGQTEQKKKERPLRPTAESPSGKNYRDPRMAAPSWHGGSNLWDDDSHGQNVLGQLAARPAQAPAPSTPSTPKPPSGGSKPSKPRGGSGRSRGRWW